MEKKQKKVLIVDDDADFRAAVTNLLNSQGYLVVIATSGKEGLTKVATEKPDLVILDVMMESEWSGYEVNQAIKYQPHFDENRHIPILMVSSIPIDPATMFHRSTEVGMITPDGYLTKPLEIPAFLEKVKSFLGETS